MNEEPTYYCHHHKRQEPVGLYVMPDGRMYCYLTSEQILELIQSTKTGVATG